MDPNRMLDAIEQRWIDIIISLHGNYRSCTIRSVLTNEWIRHFFNFYLLSKHPCQIPTPSPHTIRKRKLLICQRFFPSLSARLQTTEVQKWVVLCCLKHYTYLQAEQLENFKASVHNMSQTCVLQSYMSDLFNSKWEKQTSTSVGQLEFIFTWKPLVVYLSLLRDREQGMHALTE